MIGLWKDEKKMEEEKMEIINKSGKEKKLSSIPK